MQSDRIVKLSQDGNHNRIESRASKKLKKVLKKVLTIEKDGDIITKLSARAGSDWTLKIEQRKTRSHVRRHDSTKNLTRTIPKREYTLFKYEQ